MLLILRQAPPLSIQTDPQAADGAMGTAAKYLAQADEMEQAERISSGRISSERATG